MVRGVVGNPYVGKDENGNLKIDIVSQMECDPPTTMSMKTVLERHYKPAGTTLNKWIHVGQKPGFKLVGSVLTTTLIKSCSSDKRSKYRVKVWATGASVGNLQPYPSVSDGFWRKCYVKKAG